MSMRAIEFVENWVSENIAADGQEPAGSSATAPSLAAPALAAPALAAQCLAAAIAAGILQSEIEETFDDLPAFMAGEIEEANAREADSQDDTGDDC
jgi:hypothetical protein